MKRTIITLLLTLATPALPASINLGSINDRNQSGLEFLFLRTGQSGSNSRVCGAAAWQAWDAWAFALAEA